MAFWFFLAQLNFVLGAINLLPLPPSTVGTSRWPYTRRSATCSGRPAVCCPPAAVNYSKLLPATYVIIVVVVGYMY